MENTGDPSFRTSPPDGASKLFWIGVAQYVLAFLAPIGWFDRPASSVPGSGGWVVFVGWQGFIFGWVIVAPHLPNFCLWWAWISWSLRRPRQIFWASRIGFLLACAYWPFFVAVVGFHWLPLPGYVMWATVHLWMLAGARRWMRDDAGRIA
jgi:hypothetical protein